MLAADQVVDVGRLYGLCARVGALGALCAAFKSHVRRVGASIVLDEEKEPEMIQSLLHLKSRMDCIVVEGFGNNTVFGNALREGEGSAVSQELRLLTCP